MEVRYDLDKDDISQENGGINPVAITYSETGEGPYELLSYVKA